MRAALTGLLCLLTVAATAQTPAPKTVPKLAIIGARLYPMTGTGGVIENATIVVAGGRIESVTAGGAVPAGAEIVEAKGRVVTPGIMHAATQLGLVEISGAADTVDRALKPGTPLGAAFDVRYALNANSMLIRLARAEGTTRALSFPASSGTAPFAGQAALLHLVEGPDILERPAAAMFVNVGGASSKDTGGSRAAQWILLRNALNEAKLFPQLRKSGSPRDQLSNRLDLEALLPVVEGKTPLALQIQRESDIRQAIALAGDYKIRVVLIGATEAWRVADLLAAAKIPVILDPSANMPATFDQIGARLANAAILNKAGVTIAFSVAGRGLHLNHNAGTANREAAGIAVANGLPYEAALRALTVNPATIWGIADRYGTVAAGRDADLVIWEGDPLEPGTAPDEVFVQGRRVSLETRQTRLRDRYMTPEKFELPPGYR